MGKRQHGGRERPTMPEPGPDCAVRQTAAGWFQMHPLGWATGAFRPPAVVCYPCRLTPFRADAMTDPRLSSLLQDCPGLRLTTEPADLEHYGRDWTRRWTPAPLAIALPGSVEEVQAILRWASAHQV